MSQTLSLPPGKYSLFITPPVAGVDFTGTPTPSVSYQWRKNGTAIVGQTASTITGVWVEQSGGTVDLVDGDTISIDIILTNPVQVTTKTVSAVIDASIPAPTITPLSIRLVSAPNDPVSAIPNASIGSQIMVASAGSVSVVTTPPVLPTYQWRRGFAPIAGAAAQTYTLQASDADSIIDCVVTATNSGGTTTRTASATVGTLPAAGWTELTPSADSRLIYVSNDGDDVAAASVKGRGYYLPSDSEIGADPTNPVGPIAAYRTHLEAAKRVRLSKCNGEDANGFPTYGSGGPGGFPDWVLLRRGDSFTENPVFNHPNSGVAMGYNLGALLGGPQQPGQGWRQDQNRIHLGTGDHRGRSASEPAVVTAWGNPSAQRPVVNGYTVGGAARHVRVMSLDAGGIGWGWSSDGASAGGIIIEDCRMRHVSAMNLNTMSFDSGLLLRRCVVSGFFRTSSNSEGFFVYNDNAIVVIEECVFDKNGYREDPFDATKWTASVVNFGGLTQGTGAQPLRNARDRNLYLSAYASMTVRGNIFSRGGGGGSVQMREGGLAERNLFIWNETALGMAHPQSRQERQKGGIAKDNVVLHDDSFLPGSSGWGGGITVGGASDDLAVNDGNIIAHFHRGNNGGQSIGLAGKPPYYDLAPSKLMAGIVKDNAVYREFGGVGIMVMDTVHDDGVLAADVTGNAVSSSGTLDGGSGTVPGMLSMQGNSSKPAEFTYSGNRFHATQAGGGFRWGWSANLSGDWRDGPFTDGTFLQWQAAGYDADGTFTTDFAAFKAAAGWTAPERDIVSYMESVDPTYAVNEDVYVDEDAIVKQANRQKVWEVLSNPAAYPSDLWWQTRGPMSEARAKLTARRYHAFITFIQRAKENRKGAWDTRWTAEAVSNYIRAGFGKAPVTGAYDSRSLADRLSDYTT